MRVANYGVVKLLPYSSNAGYYNHPMSQASLLDWAWIPRVFRNSLRFRTPTLPIGTQD